jgi:hypothetical protein
VPEPQVLRVGDVEVAVWRERHPDRGQADAAGLAAQQVWF